MGFLAPWFLAGALTVGLPIWLHFLRRQRTNPQPFSSLMFFERRTETSVQPRRLRYFLLLALRTALLVLLALAFANPFVNKTSLFSTRKPLTVIAVDRSFSMRYADHMQRARDEAMKLINSVGGNNPAEVVALDAHLANLTTPTLERDTLRAAVTSIQPGDLASSFAELVRGLKIMEQNTAMALDVHFISDMQQSSMPAAFADLQVGPHTALTLHPIGGERRQNVAVEAVNSSGHVFDPKRTRVSATISWWQTDPAARTVNLVLDDRVLDSRHITTGGDNGRVQVEFTGFNVPYGMHRGEIRIEPHDALTADDAFPFSIERSDPRYVLFLSNGKPRDSFYYKAALESADNAGLLVQAVAVQQAAGEDLNKYAFVVLSDVHSLDEAVERRLTEYVRRGGSLLILADLESARARRIPVTGVHAGADTQTQGAASVDDSHPALNGLGALHNVQFYTAARLAPPPSARILARLADGSPLMIEQSMDEGRVLTFASTLDNLGSDFPLHKSFLPFVAQTARYLTDADETALSVDAGNPVELRRSRERGSAVDVVGPDGHHELSLREAASAQYFEPQREGFYELRRASGQRLLVAVHADRRESDLRPVPAETLALWHNTGASSPKVPASGENAQVHPEPQWRWILILALIAALSESIFASRYLKEERSQHDRARTTERVLAKT